MANSNAQRVENFFYESTGSSAPAPRASDYPNFFKTYNAPPDRKWQIEVQGYLLQYAKMQEGWDSYRAPPVGWDTSMFALSILNDVMRTRTPIPQVVPSAVGGVQLEWHEKGIDLELHITGPYQCELWFQDHQKPSDLPVSQELTDNFSALLLPIELLTNR